MGENHKVRKILFKKNMLWIKAMLSDDLFKKKYELKNPVKRKKYRFNWENELKEQR